MEIPKFLRVKDIPLYYPAFSAGSIRHLIFHKNTNGFDKCMRKIGKRVIILSDDFEAWIKDQ